MAWCPICKNEYREGIAECSDCGAQLVESLDMMDENKIMLISGEEARLNRLYDFLIYTKISSAELSYDGENHLAEIWINESDQINAEKYLKIFWMEEAKRKEAQANSEETLSEPYDDKVSDESDNFNMENEDNNDKKSNGNVDEADKCTDNQPYVKAEEKASNYKSSACALSLVGGVGLAVMILSALGVLQISIISNVRSISFIVLTLLFIAFIGIGIFSFKESKKYESDAKEENEVSARLKEWFKASYSKNAIEDYIEVSISEGDTEEIKYFKRTQAMRNLIKEQYDELQPAFLERLIEELYQEIYEV